MLRIARGAGLFPQAGEVKKNPGRGARVS